MPAHKKHLLVFRLKTLLEKQIGIWNVELLFSLFLVLTISNHGFSTKELR